MLKAKHNKLRNTGLLFEFLLRQITSDVLNKVDDSKAVFIVKKKFNENTELGKELALYNIIINKKFDSDRKADYFINEVINERQKLVNSTLRREKYNLIKIINEYYDLRKFISSKVDNYKIHASIYKLFEYSNILSPEDKTESHFNIVEHITSKDRSVNLSEVQNVLPDDGDLRIIAYRTLLEKFNSKYYKLNKPQKDLLKAYINNVSNTNSLKEYIEKEIPRIKRELKNNKKNLTDKVVKIKLTEAITSIEKFCNVGNSLVVKDSSVVQLMRYYELLKALKNNERK
jgi:hypothetical protein